MNIERFVLEEISDGPVNAGAYLVSTNAGPTCLNLVKITSNRPENVANRYRESGIKYYHLSYYEENGDRHKGPVTSLTSLINPGYETP